MRIISITLLFIFFLSCTQEDREAVYVDQEISISDYISSEFPENKVIRHNGSNRIIINGPETQDSLEFGDSLKFQYAGYVFSNRPSSLFATNSQTLAEENNFPISNSFNQLVEFTEDTFIEGLTSGFYGMREGEQAIILFSSKYGFDKDAAYSIPKQSSLLYEVFIEKIIKK